MKKADRFLGSRERMLTLLMMLSLCLGVSQNSVAKYIVIALSLFEVVIIITRMKININFSYPAVFIWILWSAFICISVFMNLTVEFISIMVQQIVLLLFLFCNYRVSDTLDYTSWCNRCKKMLIALLVIDTLYYIRFSYDYFSVPIMGLSFFVAIRTRKKEKFILMLALYLFVLKGRSTALALLVMLLVHFLSEKILRGRKIYDVIYWVMVSAVVCFPKMYCSFYQSEYAQKANLLVRQYTGKNLFSGRERLWLKVYQLIDEEPVWGLGGRFIGGPSDTLGMSTHNLILFLRLEGGYILLILFVLAMYYVWKQIIKYMDYEYRSLSIAYIVGLFLRVSFDLTFLANNFGQSIILWIPILFILNRCHNNRFRKHVLCDICQKV